MSYGNENPDKTFYVIRRAGSKVGLFSLVLVAIGYIKYAIDKGYIPVIDMSNSDNTYMQEDLKGNVWEYYFKQPCGYTMEDIKRSKNVIIGNGIIDGSIPYPEERMAHDNNELKIWKEIADKYLFVKEDILEEANELAKGVLGQGDILGVLLRGTDYVNIRPKNHPIQPSIGQAIEKIDDALREKTYDKIYLATEDQKIYDQLYEKYGDMLISMDVERYVTNKNENINDISINSKNNKYQIGKEYLINILLLSKCSYLIAGNAGGSQGALLLGDFKCRKYFFDLGKY